MNATSASTASVINHLIETCKDGQKGFRNAADNVERIELKTLFSDLSNQRQQFATELQDLVDSLGEVPEEGGSVSGALHRGWINLKAAVTDRDEHEILAECERGEDSAVEAYREAMSRELPDNILAPIRQQYLAIEAAHHRVRDLRDRTASK